MGFLTPQILIIKHGVTRNDSEESGGGGPPPEVLDLPDIVRYSEHHDVRGHRDSNTEKIGGSFLHHPAVMGSLEKLISCSALDFEEYLSR
ncbi:unnamed protein product [Caenorhabditis angaria]|uniref:Uncharacterized protein n=1 Tax=Caenorhabditis angaria TaxID=860376 RepID=A0A9P1NBH5_9PELO|nr:unnamed protein product [Caenorhabditis angaria]